MSSSDGPRLLAAVLIVALANPSKENWVIEASECAQENPRDAELALVGVLRSGLEVGLTSIGDGRRFPKTVKHSG